MRPDSSPTSEAARLFAARLADGRSVTTPTNPGLPGAAEERWCEWPRRPPAPRRVSIWQTLQALQARHA